MQNTSNTNRGKTDPLNHPSREEWMSYLYGELPETGRTAFDAHLRTCPDCPKRLAEWRRAMQALDDWRLPAPRPVFAMAQPFVRWGIAALFALGLGFGIGRFSVPPGDRAALQTNIAASVKASLENELRSQIRTELQSDLQAMVATAQRQIGSGIKTVAEQTLAAANLQAEQLLAAYDERLEAENQAVRAQVQSLDLRQSRLASEFAALRRDAETVALLTEDGFRRTRQQMSWLASYTATENPLPANSRAKP